METHFTPGETRLINLMIAGKRPKEIAKLSVLTYATVVTYQKRIFKKTGTHTQLELVLKVLRERNQALATELLGLEADGAGLRGEHIVIPKRLAKQLLQALRLEP